MRARVVPLQEKPGRAPGGTMEEAHMLWTIIAILLILYLLGLVVVNTSLIHLLLVIALVVLIVQLASGRRVA
jgi:hypothetical protein